MSGDVVGPLHPGFWAIQRARFSLLMGRRPPRANQSLRLSGMSTRRRWRVLLAQPGTSMCWGLMLSSCRRRASEVRSPAKYRMARCLITLRSWAWAARRTVRTWAGEWMWTAWAAEAVGRSTPSTGLGPVTNPRAAEKRQSSCRWARRFLTVRGDQPWEWTQSSISAAVRVCRLRRPRPSRANWSRLQRRARIQASLRPARALATRSWLMVSTRRGDSCRGRGLWRGPQEGLRAWERGNFGGCPFCQSARRFGFPNWRGRRLRPENP